MSPEDFFTYEHKRYILIGVFILNALIAWNLNWFGFMSFKFGFLTISMVVGLINVWLLISVFRRIPIN